MTRVLAVRLDALGDVLLTGPALRALANTADHLTLLTGPRGAEAARLLPGVDEVIVWSCPWIEPRYPEVVPEEVRELIAMLQGDRYDRAVVFTSFHQDPLPMALVLRMAGVGWVGAISEDYPGGLLDLRHHAPEEAGEPDRAVSLAVAAGGRLPERDDGRLQVLLPGSAPVPTVPYVVLHPGASAPARAWPAEHYARLARILRASGRNVVVTGTAAERSLTRRVAGRHAIDLGGRTNLAQLAVVLAGADAVVVANTGPAHLAAAVGVPVVSLFAPTVPAHRWAPYGVPLVMLGDQSAPCAGSRATECPVRGHPCLGSVSPLVVAQAVELLCGAAVSPATDRLEEFT